MIEYHLIQQPNTTPLLVGWRTLTDAERLAIPTDPALKMRTVCEAIQPYVVDWNLRAHTFDGEMVDVPAPASSEAVEQGIGVEVFQLLHMETALTIAMCMKYPQLLEAQP